MTYNASYQEGEVVYNRNIAGAMRRWRASLRMSQAEAASYFQVSLTTWSRWERGSSPIPYRERQRLIAFMEIAGVFFGADELAGRAVQRAVQAERSEPSGQP